VGNNPTNLTDPSGENPAGEAASVCLTNATISGGLSFLQQRLAGRKVNWGWGGVGGAALGSSLIGRLGWALDSSIVAGGAGASGAGGSLSGAALARAGLGAEVGVAARIGIGRNVGPGRVTIPGTGLGGYRVPDFNPALTIAARGTVVEVKNVGRLSLSPQLRDMFEYARRQGVPLEIFTNAKLPQSGQLADWIRRGLVVISPL
jgi:hypothetical protein